MALRYIVASPDKVRLVNFGGFRLVKDAAREAKARAAINFGFFSMSKNHPKDSYPVGLVIEQGAMLVVPNSDAMHFCGVYSQDGRVVISEVIPPDSDWAVTAGPRLLERGQVCERSISDPRWPAGGVSVTASKPRVAIGVRADGRCVLAYWSGATIREMAADMLSLGCVDALAGDGGGSASWYDSEHPEHNVSLRAVPNVFVVSSSDPGGGIVMAARPRIYLSPSNQTQNIGVGNYGSEQFRMRQLASIVARHLTLAGADVAMSRVDQDIPAIITDSNVYKPVYHACLHSNAGGGKGVEGFHWPGSQKGERLTREIVEALGAMNPGGFRRVVPNAALAEISGPNAVCSYIEVGFHDRADEAAWIVSQMDEIAFTMAEVICKHMGLESPVKASDSIAQTKLAEIKRIVNS